MDAFSTTMIVFAVTILVASWIMMIFAASAGDDYTWALCSFFLPPLAYLYGLYRWELAGDSIKAAIIGLVLLGVGIGTGP